MKSGSKNQNRGDHWPRERFRLPTAPQQQVELQWPHWLPLPKRSHPEELCLPQPLTRRELQLSATPNRLFGARITGEGEVI